MLKAAINSVTLFKTIVCVGILAALAIFIFPAFYTWPAADDFSYAWIRRLASYSVLYGNEYFISNGRYFSNAFTFLAADALSSIIVYRLVCIASLLILILTNVLIIRRFTRNNALIYGVLISLVQFSICPSMAECFYWYIGIITYTLSYVLGAISIVLFNDFLILGTRSRILFSTLLGILAIGCNEIAMVIIPLASLILLIFVFRIKPKASPLAYLSIVFLMMASMVVIASPGNLDRAQYFGDRFQFFHAFGQSIVYTIDFESKWLTSSSVILLFIAAITKVKPRHVLDNRRRVLPMWLVCFLLVPFIAAFLPIFSTGILGQERTFSFASLLFVWLVVILANNLRPLLLFADKTANTIHRVSVVLLLAASIFSGNGRVILEDIAINRFEPYASAMLHRNEQLQSMPPNSKAELSDIANAPNIFTVPTLHADSAFWINMAVARYYGLSQIVVKK